MSGHKRVTVALNDSDFLRLEGIEERIKDVEFQYSSIKKRIQSEKEKTHQNTALETVLENVEDTAYVQSHQRVSSPAITVQPTIKLHNQKEVVGDSMLDSQVNNLENHLNYSQRLGATVTELLQAAASAKTSFEMLIQNASQEIGNMRGRVGEYLSETELELGQQLLDALGYGQQIIGEQQRYLEGATEVLEEGLSSIGSQLRKQEDKYLVKKSYLNFWAEAAKAFRPIAQKLQGAFPEQYKSFTTRIMEAKEAAKKEFWETAAGLFREAVYLAASMQYDKNLLDLMQNHVDTLVENLVSYSNPVRQLYLNIDSEKIAVNIEGIPEARTIGYWSGELAELNAMLIGGSDLEQIVQFVTDNSSCSVTLDSELPQVYSQLGAIGDFVEAAIADAKVHVNLSQIASSFMYRIQQDIVSLGNTIIDYGFVDNDPRIGYFLTAQDITGTRYVKVQFLINRQGMGVYSISPESIVYNKNNGIIKDQTAVALNTAIMQAAKKILQKAPTFESISAQPIEVIERENVRQQIGYR
jgi:hypothetical protein